MEVNDCISSLCSLYCQLPLGSAMIYKRLRTFRSLVVLVLYDFLPLVYIHIDDIAKMPIEAGESRGVQEKSASKCSTYELDPAY